MTKRPTTTIVLLAAALLGLSTARSPATARDPVANRIDALASIRVLGQRATDDGAALTVPDGAASTTPATVPGRARPGALLWENRVDAGGFGQFFASAAGRGRVYAAGFRSGASGRNSLVRAYDGLSGEVLWEKSLDRSGDDFASGVVTDGEVVFVSGNSHHPGTGYDWTLHAYDAATGAAIWDSRFDLAKSSDFSRGTALAVHGGSVFVGGYGTTPEGHTDWVVRAHEASTGALAWQDRRDVGGSEDGVRSLTATSMGVFAGGWGETAESGNAVVRAYDNRSGSVIWQDSTPGPKDLTFTNKVVAAGNRVYVGTQTIDPSVPALAGSVRGYDARTGAALWTSPGANEPRIRVSDISLAGGRVIVAGGAGPQCRVLFGTQSDCEALVRSLHAESGALLWERLLRLSGADDFAERVVTDHGSVYVSGDLHAVHGLPGCCIVGRWFVQAFGLDSGDTTWRHVGGDAESGVYNLALDRARLFVPGRAVDLSEREWTPLMRAYDARGRVGSVDGVPPIVPAEVSLHEVSGQASFEVQFSGSLTSAVHGLVPAHVQPGQVEDDPANDIGVAFRTGVGLTHHTVAVPPGAALMQVSLFDDETDGNDDLDLFVFDADFNFVGASGSPTSRERVRVVNPAPGAYHVFVHGYETDGPDANYSLFSWAVGGDEGNMEVTVPPPGGPSGTITMSWSGLAASRQYLAVVYFSDGTFVVDTTVVVAT